MVEKRILKNGIYNRKNDRKGGISDTKIGQKSGNSVLDLLMKRGIFRVNISAFLLLEL